MMKNIINISILCCVALLGACSKSDLHGDKRLPTGEVSIQLALPSATKADDPTQGTPAENYIGMTQFVLFAPTADQSGKVERVITVDPTQSIIDAQTVWNAETQTLSMRAIDTDTPKGVYVIANATAANGYDPTAIKVGETTEKELLEAVTKLTQLTTPTLGGNGILMSGIAKSHNFKTSPALTVDLTRQLVKIKLTVKINQSFLAALPEVSFEDEQALSSVLLSLYNVPSHSFVNATTPATMPAESEMLDFSPVTITKSGSGSTLKWEAEVYVHENLILGSTDDSRKASTWLLLRLPYKNNGTLVSNNYYKFYITNPNDAVDPHKTVRNHIYDLTATVGGFGGPTPDDGKNAYVTTTVLDWNVVDLPDEKLGDYLVFSGITTTVDDKIAPIADSGYVDIRGETISIHCETNIGGWYAHAALTYKHSASIVTFEQISDTTKVISSTEVQSVTVTLPRAASSTLPTNTDLQTVYTIELYHSDPKYAPENAGPFKTLTIMQNGSVIPNSVLVKSFEANNVGVKTFDGWPVDKLPKRGLQVAKRGNLIAETALTEDLTEMWSKEQRDTKATEVGCGFGFINTETILSSNPHNYLAAYVCKTRLGQEWYLPTRNELALICANRDLLGRSYTFDEGYYWCSSQSNYNNSNVGYAWSVTFLKTGFGYFGSIERATLRKYRCVRDL